MDEALLKRDVSIQEKLILECLLHRDPNTAEEESSGLTTQRSRMKSLDPYWPVYDFSKQEYLIIGKMPIHESQYYL